MRAFGELRTNEDAIVTEPFGHERTSRGDRTEEDLFAITSQLEVPLDDVATRPEELTIGDVLAGRYRLQHVLGRGGFGAVFEARDLVIERDVAIKVLHCTPCPDASEVLRQRFRREAITAARVDHPNVVRVFDFGQLESGRPYLVMELVRGRSLEERLETRGALAVDAALALFVDALDALAIAHDAGVIHRDIKPSNFVIEEHDGRAARLRILDFGLATAREHIASRVTTSNIIVGTPRYLAPEYLQHRQVLPAGDVYQMGLVLIELLQGSPAVPAENPYQCVLAHIHGQLEIPTWLREGPLGPVLAKATALRVEDRYTDARAFRQALAPFEPRRALADTLASTPPQSSLPAPASTPPRRSIPAVASTLPPSSPSARGRAMDLLVGLMLGATLSIGAATAWWQTTDGAAPSSAAAPPPTKSVPLAAADSPTAPGPTLAQGEHLPPAKLAAPPPSEELEPASERRAVPNRASRRTTLPVFD